MPAKPGNTNALKHGLYSKHISVSQTAEMKGMAADQNRDELALARAQLARLLDKQSEAKDLKTYLALEDKIILMLGAINNMTQHNAILGRDTRTAFVTILDYIRVANDRQGVK